MIASARKTIVDLDTLLHRFERQVHGPISQAWEGLITPVKVEEWLSESGELPFGPEKAIAAATRTAWQVSLYEGVILSTEVDEFLARPMSGRPSASPLRDLLVFGYVTLAEAQGVGESLAHLSCAKCLGSGLTRSKVRHAAKRTAARLVNIRNAELRDAIFDRSIATISTVLVRHDAAVGTVGYSYLCDEITRAAIASKLLKVFDAELRLKNGGAMCVRKGSLITDLLRQRVST